MMTFVSIDLFWFGCWYIRYKYRYSHSFSVLLLLTKKSVVGEEEQMTVSPTVAKEMAQLRTCLLCKLGDLGSIPSTYTKLAVMACV